MGGGDTPTTVDLNDVFFFMKKENIINTLQGNSAFWGVTLNVERKCKIIITGDVRDPPTKAL